MRRFWKDFWNNLFHRHVGERELLRFEPPREEELPAPIFFQPPTLGEMFPPKTRQSTLEEWVGDFPPYLFEPPKEVLLEPKPLLNLISNRPAVIEHVDRTPDEEAIDRLLIRYDIENGNELALPNRTFTTEEVYSMMRTFEEVLKKAYEKTETTSDQTKPQGKTASRPRSRGRKTDSKSKTKSSGKQQRSAHPQDG